MFPIEPGKIYWNSNWAGAGFIEMYLYIVQYWLSYTDTDFGLKWIVDISLKCKQIDISFYVRLNELHFELSSVLYYQNGIVLSQWIESIWQAGLRLWMCYNLKSENFVVLLFNMYQDINYNQPIATSFLVIISSVGSEK